MLFLRLCLFFMLFVEGSLLVSYIQDTAETVVGVVRDVVSGLACTVDQSESRDPADPCGKTYFRCVNSVYENHTCPVGEARTVDKECKPLTQYFPECITYENCDTASPANNAHVLKRGQSCFVQFLIQARVEDAASICKGSGYLATIPDEADFTAVKGIISESSTVALLQRADSPSPGVEWFWAEADGTEQESGSLAWHPGEPNDVEPNELKNLNEDNSENYAALTPTGLYDVPATFATTVLCEYDKPKKCATFTLYGNYEIIEGHRIMSTAPDHRLEDCARICLTLRPQCRVFSRVKSTGVCHFSLTKPKWEPYHLNPSDDHVLYFIPS